MQREASDGGAQAGLPPRFEEDEATPAFRRALALGARLSEDAQRRSN